MKTKEEIFEMIDKASQMENNGCPFFGMSYCEGIKMGLEWAIEDVDVDPLEE